MNARLDASCILLAALLVLNGYKRSYANPANERVDPSRSHSDIVDLPVLADGDALRDAAATIVANDPFRLSNKPASVRFLLATPGVVPSALIRPQLTLRAIIGGPPWSAVVEGIPGQAGGTVVTAGTIFDKIGVRRITRDTVIIQAPDTTWKLTMKAAP